MNNSFTQDLLPDEKVLAVSRKNWTFFFNKSSLTSFFNKSSLTSLVLVLISFKIYAPFSFIVLFGTIIPLILEYANTELVLTNMRLRGRQGAFNVKTVENKASYFVGNFKTESNVLLNSLGSDTIIIQSIGVKPFVFTHMKNAKVMSNALYALGNDKELQIVSKF